MDLIRITDVQKTYKTGTVALYDIDLTISKGDFVFVIGASGSGKSTLIKMLYREEKPDKGSIMIGGINVAKLKDRKVYILRRKLGVVFQDFKLLPKLTVYENVAFAQRVIEVPNRNIKKNVPVMLSLVGLAGKYKSKIKELSGGEQQRVAIARALINNPPILLADEPTGNLDPRNTWEIMKLLETINRGGTTVIVVTHNREIVNAMRKRVITIQKGVIISDEEKGEYIDEN